MSILTTVKRWIEKLKEIKKLKAIQKAARVITLTLPVIKKTGSDGNYSKADHMLIFKALIKNIALVYFGDDGLTIDEINEVVDKI